MRTLTLARLRHPCECGCSERAVGANIGVGSAGEGLGGRVRSHAHGAAPWSPHGPAVHQACLHHILRLGNLPIVSCALSGGGVGGWVAGWGGHSGTPPRLVTTLSLAVGGPGPGLRVRAISGVRRTAEGLRARWPQTRRLVRWGRVAAATVMIGAVGAAEGAS